MQKETKLLIYTPEITTRVTYIFEFIFNQILGLEFEITHNLEAFKLSATPKFIYADKKYDDKSLFLKAHPILFEDTIYKINPEIFNFQDTKAFFKSSSDSLFPFDIFAASFYLISRYEEYLPYKADQFGRFPANESLAVKADCLEEPIIDTWSIHLKNKLIECFPNLFFKEKKYKFLSTIDIDNAYAHLHKGFFRTFSSSILLLLTNPTKFKEKVQVLSSKILDPYDNYDYLDELHKSKNIETKYFILYSKYGRFDKNLSQSCKNFQNLIKRIANFHPVGLHPSYQSNKNVKILEKEKEKLENVLGKTIEISRQHFLKLNLPETYEKLEKIEIKKDYSMGYSSNPGYRAGTCTPFFFFNLNTNGCSDLKIVPFAIMDVCFKDNLKCSPQAALKKIKKIITSVKKVNGLFVSLWHNETLSLEKEQISWRSVFEQMLDEAKDEH